MRLATVSSHLVDRATAWTLAGCLSAAGLLVWLGRADYSESRNLFHGHGYCYLWLPSLVSTHVISDLLLGLSYVAISATLVFLVWKARRELPFSWVFIAFGAFIVCCGATSDHEACALLPITSVTAIVSPSARPKPSSTAPARPARTWKRAALIASKRVAPTAKAPSR